MSQLNVNKITGTTGTTSGAPITLSADTATLGSGVTNNAGVASGTIASGVTFPAGGTGNPISVAVICDEKSYNTTGGSVSATTWTTRDLNTVISDPDSIVSISSNQFTIGAGTYLVEWSTPAYVVADMKSILYDITGSAVAHVGTSEYGGDSSSSSTGKSIGSVIITPSSSNAYEIRLYAQWAKPGNGLGTTAGTPNNVSIYTVVKIFKLK